MPRQRRLHGNTRRFDIAYFADHDRIRVVTKNRTQRGGEGKTNIGMHLKLRNARDVIFHGILDGEYTLVPRIAGDQRCIQRRAFAGTS